MRKWVGVFLAFILMMNAAGCASVQKKFTRKKKVPSHTPAVVYLQEGPYQKKYSNDYYYKTHFTFWKSWQDELINQLGGNNKKVSRAAQEALSNLQEMNQYLNPAKQEELKPQLDALAKITQRIESGGYSDSELGGIRVELEKIRRIVSNNFYYDKIKDDLLSDTIDLGEAGEKQADSNQANVPSVPVGP